MKNTSTLRLILASSSPRRRLLLREAGFEAELDPPDIDDGDLACGHTTPAEWVAAMAWLKARRVSDRRGEQHGSLILAADTVCEHDGQIFGKPSSGIEAGEMLRAMRRREHRVLTAVCLLGSDGEKRQLFIDASTVHIGELSDECIDDYVRSDEWRGKAGAYNLSERLEAGWSIRCDGDPTSVMGLPMKRLTPILEALLAESSGSIPRGLH